jgi:hypothetical protein
MEVLTLLPRRVWSRFPVPGREPPARLWMCPQRHWDLRPVRRDGRARWQAPATRPTSRPCMRRRLPVWPTSRCPGRSRSNAFATEGSLLRFELLRLLHPNQETQVRVELSLDGVGRFPQLSASPRGIVNRTGFFFCVLGWGGLDKNGPVQCATCCRRIDATPRESIMPKVTELNTENNARHAVHPESGNAR